MADTPSKSEIPAPMQRTNVERDRQVEIAPKLAQHEAERENIEELRERAANSAQRAEPGQTYRGKIIAVTAEHVLQQRENRANEVIQHDRIALSGAVREGRDTEISYPHGKAGLATDMSKASGHDRQHQHQHQNDRRHIEAERD